MCISSTVFNYGLHINIGNMVVESSLKLPRPGTGAAAVLVTLKWRETCDLRIQNVELHTFISHVNKAVSKLIEQVCALAKISDPEEQVTPFKNLWERLGGAQKIESSTSIGQL